MILGPNINGCTSYLTFWETEFKDNKTPCFGAFKANAYQLTTLYSYPQNDADYRWTDLAIYANLSNFLYGSSNTVQPTSLVLNYVIKY